MHVRVVICQCARLWWYPPSTKWSHIETAITSVRGVGKHASQLPLTRVKNIIKSDPDITLASQEATLVISKVRMQCGVYI